MLKPAKRKRRENAGSGGKKPRLEDDAAKERKLEKKEKKEEEAKVLIVDRLNLKVWILFFINNNYQFYFKKMKKNICLFRTHIQLC